MSHKRLGDPLHQPRLRDLVPQGKQVRILDYRGDYHYLARYDGTVGQLERSKVRQDTCYQ